MSTPAKRWPVNAENARMDAIARSQRIVATVRAAIEKETSVETMRLLVKIGDLAQETINGLKECKE